MFARSILRLSIAASVALCLATVIAGAAFASAPPQRDWQKNAAIVEVDTTHDIYAVGDPHGDYERLVMVLVAAKIMPLDPGPPEKAQWQAGKAILICPGDLINKGEHSLRVIALLRTLQTEAARAGGQVIVTMGNHEAWFLSDHPSNKTTEFYKELLARGIDPSEIVNATDKDGIGAWLRGLPLAARVNDWFFSHAGNTGGRTLPKLRADLQNGIDKAGFTAPVLLAENGLLEARLRPEPWWEAPGDTPAQSVKRLAQGIEALGVRHLVMGHQPAKIVFNDATKRPAGELFAFSDGRVFLIDTGMSRAVGFSNGAVLQIHQGANKVRANRIDASGKSTEIWSGPASKKSIRQDAMHQNIVFNRLHVPLAESHRGGQFIHAVAADR